ncbi:MAG: LLM class flavin-dependent oxidoreductase [Betaproteobacteria bacterium]|nr:LLM class flavin-dependent oxidoreductase [Betaproteobacteria bacterium]
MLHSTCSRTGGFWAYSDECLRIYKELWTKDDPSFNGRYHSFTGIKFAPKPIQKPHPPIWIGGHTAAARRRAGQFGDAWHPVAQRPTGIMSPEETSQAMVTVREAAAQAGRDPQSITISLRIVLNLGATATAADRRPFSGSPSQVADDIRRYAEVGVSHLVVDVMTSDPDTVNDAMDRFANEVRPRLGSN